MPKERFISYPGAERTSDPAPVITWAGYNHLQQAIALASYHVRAKEEEGFPPERLVPLLAGLDQLVPWLKQWHNDLDPNLGMGQGDYFAGFLDAKARELGVTVEQLRAWRPEARASKAKKAVAKKALPQYTKTQIAKGTVVAYALALLRTWGKPATREALEAGLILALNDDIRQVLTGRNVPFAEDCKIVPGFDRFLAGLEKNGYITLDPSTPTQQIIAAGPNCPELSGMPTMDLEIAKEAISALAVIKVDRRKVTDTDALTFLRSAYEDKRCVLTA